MVSMVRLKRFKRTAWILVLPLLLTGSIHPVQAKGKRKRPKVRVMTDDAPSWQPEPYLGCKALGYSILQGPGLQAGLPRRINMRFGKDGEALLFSERTILHIDKNLTVRLLVGRPGVGGFQDGPARLARFNKIGGVVEGKPNEFFINDRGNLCIRRLYKKQDGSWHVETIAGVPGKKGKKDGPAKEALFQDPCNLAMNSKGELFSCDRDFIRKIADGQVTTLNPKGGSGYVDGALESAKFQMIMGAGCAFDDQDNLFICDRWNNRFRKIDMKTQTVSTYAGSGIRGHHSDAPFEKCIVEPGGLLWNSKRKSFYAVMVDSADLARLEGGWLKTVIKGCPPVGLDAEGSIYSAPRRRSPIPYRILKYTPSAAPKETQPMKKEGKK